MKKQLLILTSLFIIYGTNANAQSVTIDPKANNTPVFEIKSTTEGMVMPKLTVAQRNVMAGLTAGTQVYCTDCTPYGPYNYDGGSWVAMFQTQTVSPITYTVGQAAQGGIVFWIDPASGGQHGLVAATSDVTYTYLSTRHLFYFWKNNVDYIQTYARGMYGGEINTKLAVGKMDKTHDFFYSIFAQAMWYNGGGYGDWYVPSAFEIQEMYNQRNTIGNFFTDTYYWTSTKLVYASGYAYPFSFSNGVLQERSMDEEFRLRVIRRF